MAYFSHLLDPSLQHKWPPQDPNKVAYYNGTAHDFRTDKSPWTYGDEKLNPCLIPSNSYRRIKNECGRSDVPPYHPSYQPSDHHWVQDDSDDERSAPPIPRRSSSHERDEVGYEVSPWNRQRIRRGSEGFEVREQSREEILRRYIASRGEQPGRYKRYSPETDSASADEVHSQASS